MSAQKHPGLIKIPRACIFLSAAMRALRRRRLATALSGFGLVFMAGITMAGARYTDLRHIEPIHGNPAAGEKKASLCFACHGANGVPLAPTFPRLAGQRADYLYHRLVAFKHAGKKDPYYSASPMTPIAATLTEGDMRNLAAYFSAQAPAAANAASIGPTETTGESLFLHGNPSQGIPPCQGCHGADANGTAMVGTQYLAFPSLRGQSALYLTARLKNFRQGLPADTSNAFIMASVARTLDDASIQAIATWLSSLNPARCTPLPDHPSQSSGVEPCKT
jgi:cytochrome c553